MDDSLLVFIRRAIRALLILIVLGVVLNDAIRTAGAVSLASDGMNAASGAAIDSASAAPDDVAAGNAAAADAAEVLGTRLEAYEQVVVETAGARQARVAVTVSAPLDRTLIAAPIVGLINGTPSSGWYTDPRIVLSRATQVSVLGTSN